MRRFANDVAELRPLADWIRAYAEEVGLDEDLTYHVDLCLDEAVANVIRYGYTNRSDGTITVSLEATPDGIRAVVTDSGREFNPLRHPAPEAPVSLDDLPVGGLGIHVMRSFADSLEYCRNGERNILTLEFRRKA